MEFKKNPNKTFKYNPDKLGNNPDWRLQRPRMDYHRLKLDIKDLDTVFGGLPYGLTVFVGDAGTGKSTLAQFISNKMADKGANVLYAFAESLIDVDLGNLHPNVKTANFYQMLPKWQTVIEQLMYFCSKLDIDLLVIDSLTTMFSETNKSVEEADLRGALSELKERVNSQIPIIAISQIRGQGMFTYPAGGKAVDHIADLLVYFAKTRGTSEAGQYAKSFGNYIFTLHVQKDKMGMAKQSREYEVIYTGEDINLREIR